MPRVFVVNRSGHDFSAAEKWGTIEYLTEGTVNRYNVNEMYRLFADGLRDSKPDDFILCTSLTQMNMVAAACFVFLHSQLNLLIHKGDGYVERSIELGHLLP